MKHAWIPGAGILIGLLVAGCALMTIRPLSPVERRQIQENARFVAEREAARVRAAFQLSFVSDEVLRVLTEGRSSAAVPCGDFSCAMFPDAVKE